MAFSSTLEFADILLGSELSRKVCSHDVNILFEDDRVICVRLSAPRVQMLCLSVHGFDMRHGDQDV